MQDARFRDRLTRVEVEVQALELTSLRFLDKMRRTGQPPGADVSMLKIWASETFQRIADLIVETAGPFGALAGDVDFGQESLNPLATFYKARVPTIYGGSSEIQRNILARQVLDLPG